MAQTIRREVLLSPEVEKARMLRATGQSIERIASVLCADPRQIRRWLGEKPLSRRVKNIQGYGFVVTQDGELVPCFAIATKCSECQWMGVYMWLPLERGWAVTPESTLRLGERRVPVQPPSTGEIAHAYCRRCRARREVRVTEVRPVLYKIARKFERARAQHRPSILAQCFGLSRRRRRFVGDK